MAQIDPWQPYQPPAPEPASGDATAGAASDDGLWQEWWAERLPATRERLVQRYGGYAKALAARLYQRQVDREIEFGDFLQFAMIGLIEAIERYQPGRGARFTTYATPNIRGAMLKGIQHLSERQEQIVWRRRALAERTTSLAPETFAAGDAPNLLNELLEVATGLALGFLLDGTGLFVAGKDSLPGNAYAQIELRQLRDRLGPLLDRLTERERAVIRHHYLEGRPFEEVARLLDLSKGRVSQLHRQALARLRILLEEADGKRSVTL
jgi:RNA polymerase sigma factor for flagellar operon FliA